MTKHLHYGENAIRLHEDVDISTEAYALARLGQAPAAPNARIDDAVREVRTADGSHALLVLNLGFPVFLTDNDPEGNELPPRYDGA